MKLMCKLFGHKWIYYDLHKRCKRCDEIIWFSEATFDLFKINQQLKKSLNDDFKNLSFNRSDLDESSGSHEKLLEEHMD